MQVQTKQNSKETVGAAVLVCCLSGMKPVSLKKRTTTAVSLHLKAGAVEWSAGRDEKREDMSLSRCLVQVPEPNSGI